MRTLLAKRARPPLPDKPRSFRFPEFQTHTFGNGLKLYSCTQARGPLVQVSFAMTGGAVRDTSSLAGRTSLAASLLDEGTSQHTSLELAARIEVLGGYLATQADWDSMSASVGMLSSHLQSGFELLSEVVTDATMPQAEVDRLRGQRLAEIQRRQARPGIVANEALAALIYGGTSPYGAPLVGTLETISNLTRDHLYECLCGHTSPGVTAIIAVGDLTTKGLVDLAHKYLNDWQSSPTPILPDIEASRLDSVEIRIIDRPDSPQTELRLGHAGPSRTDPDYVPLQVMNSLLGGKFTSRINLKLREDLGITYGASSGFANRRGHGPFTVSTSVDTGSVGVAAKEILRELRRMQQEPVSTEELEETKNYLLGVFPYTLQRIEGIANRIAEIALYDLPLDYYDRSLATIRDVDLDQLQRLAQKHLHPDRIGIVAVGPAAVLAPQLERIGGLEILSKK